MQTVATMRWTLCFGVVLDSMQLFHYEVLVSFHKLGFGGDEASEDNPGVTWTAMFITEHIFQAFRLIIEITALMSPGQTQKAKVTTRTRLWIKKCQYRSLNRQQS